MVSWLHAVGGHAKDMSLLPCGLCLKITIWASSKIIMPNYFALCVVICTFVAIFIEEFMKTITLKDKTFGVSIPEAELLKAVDAVAQRMTADLKGKNPLFLVVLNGAFMFASDLLKRVEVPGQVSFIKLSSYCGTGSTGNVCEVLGLNESVEGRTVVVIEDIIDSGLTMSRLVERLRIQNVEDLKVATLFFKPEALRYDVKIDYVAMHIPNDFIVGYGLDYDGYGRNLRDIYTLIPEK